MLGFRILIVLMFLSLLLQAQTGGGEVTLRRLQQAAAAISEGQLAKAQELLNAVLATAPRDADATNLLGVVRAQQKRTVEAERLFRLAITFSPTHVGARVNLGELLLTTNRAPEALTILLVAHKLAPERSDVNTKQSTEVGASTNGRLNIFGSCRAPLRAPTIFCFCSNPC
jgi:Flp pilus assembly protein TadD